MPFTVRGIVYSAVFAAVLVVFSYLNIHLGFTAVPITLQNFAVMLIGGLLGARYGFFSVALVIGLAAIGVPIWHGTGGPALILGPTGGFMWGYPMAALLIGAVVPRIKGNGIRAFALTFVTLEVFGSLLLYVTGVPWLAHAAHMSLQKALVAGCYPFLPGDAVKALVATFVVLAVRQSFPLSRLYAPSVMRRADERSIRQP